MRRVFAGLLLLLGLGLAQMDKMQMGSQQTAMSMQSMTELDKLSGKNFDIAYMSMMIEHHKGAVTMAQQALKVSKDARIRRAAQAIVRVQNQEISQLAKWLKGWYGVSPSTMYMNMMQADMASMMSNAMSGMTPMTGMEMPVDRSFLEGMIPHHQDAVYMSQSCLKRAAKAELKRFCQGVITAQNSEINQYQEWLKSLK